MQVDADKTGVESTSNDDARITKIGRFIRTYKIDEISQLWNVFIGNMSLVGPRPNTLKGVSVYSQEELKLLDVKPGMTDISSIVFSDEGEILLGREDPDEAYDKIIRPWKSLLGLLYIHNQSLSLDIKLIYCTFLAIYNKKKALIYLNSILIQITEDKTLIEVCKREIHLDSLKPEVHNIVQ